MTRELEKDMQGNSLQRTSGATTHLAGDLEQFDAIVIGAGVTGLYQLYCLRQLGLSVRVF